MYTVICRTYKFNKTAESWYSWNSYNRKHCSESQCKLYCSYNLRCHSLSCSNIQVVILIVVKKYVNRVLLYSEPTNNVAPRVSGAKISGSHLEDVKIRSTAALKCGVTAYPIPIFRYFLSINIYNLYMSKAYCCMQSLQIMLLLEFLESKCLAVD